MLKRSNWTSGSDPEERTGCPSLQVGRNVAEALAGPVNQRPLLHHVAKIRLLEWE